MCGTPVHNEEIGQEIHAKQAEIDVLLAEIKEIRGQKNLHEEISALRDPSLLQASLSVIALEDEILKLKLEELLSVMKEKRALEAAAEKDLRCEVCAELERRLGAVEQDYERMLKEVRELRREKELEREELRVGVR
jgi:hypothetical protein